MNLDEVKKIISFMDEHKLVEFEMEEEGKRVRLRRAEGRIQTVPAVDMAAAPAPAAASKSEANGVEFKAPLVGTFYRASKPGAEPYVNVGDEVTPDKVLCIIEAMKVMNEIKAEMTGIIRDILPKNGQAVEFGETLFLIEKK